jgi:hypothetical protein
MIYVKKTVSPLQNLPKPGRMHVIPLYTRDDEAALTYFSKFQDVADALTGTTIDVVLPKEIEDGIAQAFENLFENEENRARFQGLKRSDLPCLWIEDSNGGHDLVTMSAKPGDMIKVLADQAGSASSASELAHTLRIKLSEREIDNSPVAKAELHAIDRLIAAMREQLPMSKAREKLIAVVFGAAFLVALLALAVFFPQPTSFQYTVFRIVLAVAASGFVSMTPGFIEVTVSNWVRGGGALGVFLVVYFFSPAALVANP